MINRLVYLSVAILPMTGALPQERKDGHSASKDHVVFTPSKVQWLPAPPGLPKGAQIAILAGDPNREGSSYTLRIKAPDGFKVPPHWHPTDENVTVLQGTFLMGRGDQFDAKNLEEIPAGGYMRMPKEMRHFAQTKGETILQLHGVGPFEINYVNPADDPRKKANQ